MKKVIILICTIILSNQIFAEELKERVGILDFAGNNVADADALAIGAMFSSELVKIDYYDVVDRKNLDSIMKELGLQMSECIESSCALEIGQILSLDKMIYGNISKLDKKFILNVYIINVKTAQIESSSRVRFNSLGDSYNVIDEVIIDLIGETENISEEKLSDKNDNYKKFAFEPGLGLVYFNNYYITVILGAKYMVADFLGISCTFPVLYILASGDVDSIEGGYNFGINTTFKVNSVLSLIAGAELQFSSSEEKMQLIAVPGIGMVFSNIYCMFYYLPLEDKTYAYANLGVSIEF